MSPEYNQFARQTQTELQSPNQTNEITFADLLRAEQRPQQVSKYIIAIIDGLPDFHD